MDGKEFTNRLVELCHRGRRGSRLSAGFDFQKRIEKTREPERGNEGKRTTSKERAGLESMQPGLEKAASLATNAKNIAESASA